MKNRNSSRKFIFEQLEPRLLLSADLDPISLAGQLPVDNIEFVSTVVETGLDSGVFVVNGAAAEQFSSEIFFVDSNIPDFELLVDDLLSSAGAGRKIEIITLEADRDGVEQISEILSGRQDIAGVHIISHGTDGAVKLGNVWLSSDTIAHYADAIGGWQDSLSSEADLLLYGCDLAAGEDGRALLAGLSSLTGADVAASDDLTGSAEFGGDWILEYAIGSIESNVALSLETQANWSDVLANVTISGTVFEQDGTTPIANETVRLIVNGNDEATVDTDGSGNYSITADISNGESFLLYLDDGNAGGDTVSVATSNGSGPHNLDLYFNHMIIYGDSTGNATTSDLDDALGSYDGNNAIGYTVTGNDLEIKNTYLYIPSGTTFTPDGDVYVDGVILEGTIDGGGNTFEVDGDWDASDPSASFTGNTDSTLTFTSGSPAFFNPGTSSYQNIILFKGGGKTVTLENNLTVVGDITITRGNLDVSASNYSIDVGGDFSNSDTFTAREGTVTLTGTNQTISGSTTFYNLTKSVTSADTLTFGAGDTITIAPGTPGGTLTLDGDPGQMLTVTSSSAGSHWLLALSPGSSKSFDYLDVSWSDATLSDVAHRPIDPANSTDSGNNTEWFSATLNNSPSSTGIADVTVNVDAPNTVIPLLAVFTDAEDNDSDLIYMMVIESNTNPGLFTSTTIDQALDTLTLDYAPGQNGIAVIKVRATDSGGLYTESTFTVTVNAPPTINGTVAGQAIDDVDFVAPFSGVTIGDLDVPAQTLTVTVSLDVPAKGIFSTLSGFTETGPSTGIFTFSGTAVDASTAIRGMVYDPANNRVATGLFETTTFTIDVEDGIAPTVSDSTTTVDSTSVDFITISGKVFINEGSTAIADGTTVRVLVNGVSRGTTTTFGGDGSYSISNIPVTTGESILVYLDDDAGPGNSNNTNDGVTVSVTDGDNQNNFDVYTDHLIVRHDDGGIMTNGLIDAAKGAYNDSEIIYTVSGSDLTVNGVNTELYLLDIGNGYIPGGNITAPNFETWEAFDGGTFTINISGDLTISKNTFNGNSSIIDVNRDLIISGGSFLSTSNTLTVNRHFNSTDHNFTHNNGTVILDGNNQNVSGSLHFYNLEKSVSTARTLTFQAGKHIRIDPGGSLTLRGEPGQLLSLVSSASPSQWDLQLQPNVTTDIEYVAVSDSDASQSDSSEKPVNAANSLDVTPLNNIDWFIYGGGTPGGVMDSIQFWIKADNGVTEAGGLVNQWDNLVVDGTENGTLPNVQQATAGEQPLFTANTLNFNPVVIFDGINDDLSDFSVDGKDLFQDDQASIFIVEMDLDGTGGVIFQWLDDLDNRVSVEWSGPPAIGPRFDYGDFDRAPVPESITGSSLSAGYHIINTQVVPSVVGGDPDDLEIYIDGKLDTSATTTNNPLNSGANGKDFSLGQYPLGGFNRNMALAEIIIYNTDLSAADRLKVESYMAVKYGITLDQSSPVNYVDSDGTVIWDAGATANSAYSNDIAGIGYDITSGLNQTISSSINTDSIVTVSAASSQDDGDFLLWGNDNGSLTETVVNLPPGVDQRLQRIWTIEETGDIGTVTISFDVSGLGVTGTTASDFKLIIDSNTTFTSGATIVSAASFAGNIVTFNNVNFSDGQFFALGTDYKAPPVISWDANNSGGGADNDGFETTFTEGGAAQVIGDADSSVVDSDDTAMSSLTLTAAGILDGANEIFTIGGSAFAQNADKTDTVTVGATDFDITYTTATGVFAISNNAGGDMPIADMNTLLAGITYQNTLANPTDGNRTLSAVTNDGDTDSNTAVATINVNPVNNDPVISWDANNSGGGADNDGFETTFTEGGAAQVIGDADSSVVDSDDTAISSLTLTAAGILDGANEIFTIGGSAFAQNADKTDTVTVGATDFDITYTTATGVFAISNNAGGDMPIADMNTLLAGITYQNTLANPTDGNRTLSAVTNDGDTDSNTAVATINVNPVNNDPVISWDANNSGGGADNDGFETTFTEGGAAQVIGDADSSVVDSDDTAMSSLTLTAAGILDGANEIFTIGGSAFAQNADKTDTVTVGATDFDITYTTATGVFAISNNAGGDMPIADMNTLLAGITYQNTLANPTDGNRTLSAVTNDGDTDSNTAVATINVNPVNNDPVISWDANNSGGGADNDGFETTFTEGGAAQVIGDADSSVVDSDDTAMSSLTLTAAGILDGANEIFTIGGSAFAQNADKTDTVTVGATDFDITYTTATGVFAISNNAGGDMPIADMNTLLAGITYQNTLANPTDGNRTLSAVTNDGDTDSNTAVATINVNPTNDPPTSTGLADIKVDEDAPDTPINLSSVFADVEDANLTYTVRTNTNSGLVSTSLAGSTLTLDYVADQFGTADITIRATDSGGLYVDDTFRVTVNPVNDTPTTTGLADITVDENAPDTVINLAKAFADVEDATLNYTVTANSDSGLVAASTAGNNLTLNYGADQNGVANITVRATDSGDLFVETTFRVTVNPVNDAPTTTGLANVTVNEDAPDSIINLSSAFSDDEDATLTYTVTANSDSGLVAASTAGNNLTLNYGADQNGVANITVRATDSGDLFVETTFRVTVNPVNDAPTASNLNTPETYTEDSPLNLTPITVSDVDGGSLAVTLTLSDPAVGILNTGSSGGVTSTFDPVSGKWQASGSVTSVNNLLAGVTFTPAADAFADFSISVTVDDGSAPPLTGIKTMTGLPVGDTPQVDDITTDRLSQSGLIKISPHENDGAEVTHFRVSAIHGGSLFLANGTTGINEGDYITAAQGLAGVKFTPLRSAEDTDGGFQAESSQDGATIAAQSGAAVSVVTVTEIEINPNEIIDDTPEPPPAIETDTKDTSEIIEDVVGTEPEVEEIELIAEETFDSQDDGDFNEAGDDGEQTVVTSPLKLGLDPAGISFRPVEIASLSPDFYSASQNSGQSFRNNMLRGSAPTPVNASRTPIDWGVDYKITSILLQNSFDAMEQEAANKIRLEKTVVGSAIAATTSLSVGYVVWLLRSGMLLSSLLSSLPAWQIADPLPILARLKDEDDMDDESMEDIIGDDDTEQEQEQEKSGDEHKKETPDVS